MTYEKPHYQGHMEPRTPMGNTPASVNPSISPVASSVAVNLDDHGQERSFPTRVIVEHNDSANSALRPSLSPPLMSGKISADLVHEIREVIKQEC
jgi:hypothetical protein